MFFRAIDKALEKPSPGSIPLSGPRALENDFYSVHLEDSTGKDQVWLKGKADQGYEALVRADNDSGNDKILTQREIENTGYTLRIEHYYKGYQFNYSSPLKFLLAYYFRWHRWVIFRDRNSQKRFNRQPLIRMERMNLLQYLVERSIQKPREKFDPLFLGMQLYTRRWFFHPGKDEQKEHLKLLLESFAESGELKRDNGGYVLSGKALETLSNHELEKQQHRDNLATAKVGNNLTWAIVVVGLLGIGAQSVMWWLENGAQ
ncbi:hypothetical protein GPM19_00630 [Halomonas sp. ZH2S]|uniref:Uncharacterized protein n=1 Tax=Vreelandella zhuhanensis TaxID=2684210 RepID=A0A7X3GY60_9GAMM|nr:hypothetical protein [Halomonas zhuhanensis]MWJ26724.1 hypothetical protein [Halomonas zhuhanensis]